MKRFLTSILAFAAILGVTPAHAFDGVTTGTIATLEYAADGNNDLRVTQTGITTMRTGQSYGAWARITSGTNNYKEIGALLMLAASTGLSVTLYTNVSSGICYIQYADVAF